MPGFDVGLRGFPIPEIHGVTMIASLLHSGTVVTEEPAQEANGRVHEAPAAALSIQCQPYAARGGNDIMWPGTTSDISAERIVLLLGRRFEPQTILSVSLPEIDAFSASSVIARVTRVERNADGRWLLDCAFLTPIDEKQLHTLLEAIKRPPTATETDSASSVTIEKATVRGVLFQVRYGTSDPIRRAVSQLHVNGSWPLTIGRVMKAWVGRGPRNESAADVRVNGCYYQNRRWLVDCSFLGAPPDALLEKLRTGIM
jgi:hypothetical protein